MKLKSISFTIFKDYSQKLPISVADKLCMKKIIENRLNFITLHQITLITVKETLKIISRHTLVNLVRLYFSIKKAQAFKLYEWQVFK